MISAFMGYKGAIGRNFTQIQTANKNVNFWFWRLCFFAS